LVYINRFIIIMIYDKRNNHLQDVLLHIWLCKRCISMQKIPVPDCRYHRTSKGYRSGGANGPKDFVGAIIKTIVIVISLMGPIIMHSCQRWQWVTGCDPFMKWPMWPRIHWIIITRLWCKYRIFQFFPTDRMFQFCMIYLTIR